VKKLGAGQQARLREVCREKLAPPPFVMSPRAWAVRGLA
jgi:hypothetical protein